MAVDDRAGDSLRLLPLDEATDAAVAGTKAATLAALRAAAIRVPDGIVLPVGAPPALRDELAHRVVESWPGAVAVRSSSTWEDHATSAHAGESLTTLSVEGVAGVRAATEACLASAVGGRPGDGVAVLVQPMLAPDHAGVAFGADPSTGDTEVVRIQAVEGVAAGLLAGAVTGSDATVRGDVVSGDRGSLDDDAHREVARLVRRLGALLGGPQDVEWALVEGELHVLQSRPITVLPVAPTMPAGNGWQKDTTHHTGPITPFGWSVLASLEGDEVVRPVFGDAGLILDGLDTHLAGGELYTRPRPVVGPADPGAAPPPPAAVLGVVARLHPALRARTRAAAAVLREGRADAWITEWRTAGRQRLADRIAEERAVVLRELGDRELAAVLGRLGRLAHDAGTAHFRVFVPYVLRLHTLHQLLETHLTGWSPASTASLLAGASPATRAGDESLTAVRAGIDARLAEALQASPDEPLEVLGRAAPELAAALSAWLEVHGWRPPNYDAGVVTLAEQPRLLTRRLLAPDGASTAEVTRAARAQAVVVRERLPAAARDGFATALAAARRVHPLREETGLVADEVLGLHRRWMLEVGRRLVERGVLGGLRAVPYLDGAELVAALDGSLDATQAAALVTRRRGEEAWARANPGPTVIGDGAGPPDISRLPTPLRELNQALLWMVGQEYPDDVEGADPAGDVAVTGVGSSPGVVTGPVRVITEDRDLPDVEPGEVLVCPVTTPAWVAVLPLCAAVVADGGGALSHAAIAAREHGIPAVLGCGEATTTLVTGEHVRVDGADGTVTRLG